MAGEGISPERCRVQGKYGDQLAIGAVLLRPSSDYSRGEFGPLGPVDRGSCGLLTGRTEQHPIMAKTLDGIASSGLCCREPLPVPHGTGALPAREGARRSSGRPAVSTRAERWASRLGLRSTHDPSIRARAGCRVYLDRCLRVHLDTQGFA